MKDLVLMIALAIFFVIAVVISFLFWVRQDTRRMILEFEQRFPGKCVVCSFDRECRRNGIYVELRSHDCPEGGG